MRKTNQKILLNDPVSSYIQAQDVNSSLVSLNKKMKLFFEKNYKSELKKKNMH